MKTELSYLPSHKQAELAQITEVIRESIPVEMIILFGSYARGNWVEEMYDETHYKYQSDFDLLVVVENQSEATHTKLEQEIEIKLEQLNTVHTPVAIIVHTIKFVNARLHKRQYFFSDIQNEGILLYTSGKYHLEEARELPLKERKKLAQDDFNKFFEKAENLYEIFHVAFDRKKYNEAVFLLHQVAERLYTGILLVYTRYKPNTHDLIILRKLTNSVDNRLVKIFPFDTLENRRLFKILRKAYIDARYKDNYTINEEELKHLAAQVEQLREMGELICKEKINSFSE